MTQASRTDRLGVHQVGTFFADVGWLFREQPTSDVGIDAQVEVVEGNEATGALIGMQIKAGASYFNEQSDDHIVFRATDHHINYWLRHSLPVIVVLCDVQSGDMYWEEVASETVISTGSNWRINIPKSKILSSDSLPLLAGLLQPPRDVRRLNKLRLDRKWIDLVAKGENVYVEFEDWVNKSLPRFQVTIGCDTVDEVEEQVWPTTYGADIEDLLGSLIPWADFKMDMEAYEDYMREVWQTECYSWHDKETGETYYTRPFEEFYAPPDGIERVGDNGETEAYRLIVSLNNLGQAFLNLDDYLQSEDEIEDRTFTIE